MQKKLLYIWLVSYQILCINFQIREHQFYDNRNGSVIFHGVNIVNKQYPYETNLNQDQILKLKQTGINAMRTDVSWTGVQPENGTINYTYLENKRQFVNRMGKNGIYTLLEFHQDLFSEKFCGDGVPIWAIPEEIYQDFAKPTLSQPPVYRVSGAPTKEYCWKKSWSSYYKTYACNRAFKALYSNQYGLRDAFIRYWRLVANTFRGNPYIIGYELLNQPWPGNMYRNPLIMIPTLSEMFNLKKFNDILALAIRQVDPHQNIGFEPITWLNGLPSGYSHAPGGRIYSNRSIYCFHYYHPPTISQGIFMAARMLDMKRLGVGGLLTEFFATDEEKLLQGESKEMLRRCDKKNIGWFAWQYRHDLNYEMLSRVYTQRVGGHLVTQLYDDETAIYTLEYESRLGTGETVIYFPKNVYKDGFILTMDPMTRFEIREQKYIIIQSNLIGNRIVILKIEKPGDKNIYVWNFKYQNQERSQQRIGGNEQIMKRNGSCQNKSMKEESIDGKGKDKQKRHAIQGLSS